MMSSSRLSFLLAGNQRNDNQSLRRSKSVFQSFELYTSSSLHIFLKHSLQASQLKAQKEDIKQISSFMVFSSSNFCDHRKVRLPKVLLLFFPSQMLFSHWILNLFPTIDEQLEGENNAKFCNPLFLWDLSALDIASLVNLKCGFYPAFLRDHRKFKRLHFGTVLHPKQVKAQQIAQCKNSQNFAHLGAFSFVLKPWLLKSWLPWMFSRYSQQLPLAVFILV